MPDGMKAGARNSSSDLSRLQQIHDLSVENGAECGSSKSIKAIPPGWNASDWAMSQAWKVQDAANMLVSLANMAGSEFGSTGDPASTSTLDLAMRQLCEFILKKLDEVKIAVETPAAAPETEASEEQAEGETPAEEAAEAEPMMKRLATIGCVKSIGFSTPKERWKELIAVKSLGTDDIRGYSMLWGGADLEGEFFEGGPKASKSTNFWDAELSAWKDRPLSWDHAQDIKTAGNPIIGRIEEWGDDEIGRWYKGKLARHHAYRKAIDGLISERAVGTSSDTASQYVIREPLKDGRTFLARWPWFASALTEVAAEGRMYDIGAVHWKSLNLDGELARMGSALNDATLNALAEMTILTID